MEQIYIYTIVKGIKRIYICNYVKQNELEWIVHKA